MYDDQSNINYNVRTNKNTFLDLEIKKLLLLVRKIQNKLNHYNHKSVVGVGVEEEL